MVRKIKGHECRKEQNKELLQGRLSYMTAAIAKCTVKGDGVCWSEGVTLYHFG